MARVIVFGIRDFASLAHFHLRHDSPHEVVAFSVSLSYMPDTPRFEGRPVVPFEEIEDDYDPGEYAFFVPMSHRKMNQLREGIYNRAKAKGYPVISYVSSRATVFPGTEIGDNCFILEDNTIQPYARIGNNVMMWSGNLIGHHAQIKDHVFLSAHVVIGGHCIVEPHCFFGLNATVRDGLHIAKGTMVTMSAAVVRDTEPWGVYQALYARKGLVPSNELDF